MGGSKLSEKLIKDYLKTKKLIKLFQYDISLISANNLDSRVINGYFIKISNLNVPYIT